MRFVLQRILLSATVLICLAAANTTIGKSTPTRPTTTRTTTTVQAQETTKKQTPTRSTSAVTPASLNETSASRGPTPTKGASTVSPAKLDQTPTTSGKNGGSSSSMRPTPTTTLGSMSQSASTLRTTPLNQVETGSATTVSLRPTPSGGSSVSAGTVSKRDTPKSSEGTPQNQGGSSTSFISQPFSSPTAAITQFITMTSFVTATTFMTQPVPSTTQLMTPQPSTTFMSQPGESSVSGSGSTQSGVTTGGMTGGATGGQTTVTMGATAQETTAGRGMNTTSAGVTQGGGGGGPVIHAQLMFCNMYDSLNIPNSDPGYTDYLNQIQRELAKTTGADVTRFLYIVPQADPVTKRLVLQFDILPGGAGSMPSDDISRWLNASVAAKNFTLTDKAGVKLNCNCDPANTFYPWTDYGPCPSQRCMNGGMCKVALTGHYYCWCPPPFSGNFCTEVSGSSASASTTVSGASAMSGSPSGGQPESVPTTSAGAGTSSSSLSTSMSGGMTTPSGGTGGEGGGQLIHVQIIFCNKYSSLYIPTEPDRSAAYYGQLELAMTNAFAIPAGRIQHLFIVPDRFIDPPYGRAVMQFDVLPGPGMTSDDIVLLISNRVASKTLSLTDMFLNVIFLNCYDLPFPAAFPWTDYGPCPDQRCMNGGRCNVKAAGQYYCQCLEPFTGRFCDQQGPPKSESNNLLWLLTIPAAIALLSLILFCLCCRRCCCCVAGPRKIVEVIEEDVYQDMDTRSIRSGHSCRSCASQPSIYCPPMMTNDPGSTYYSAVGRPFAVAFNDNTFSAIGYATNDPGFYTMTGGKRAPSLCGDEEIQVIRRGSCCGSDYGGYHSAGMGNKYVVAYNDRTFNTYSSMPRYDRMHSYN